MVITATEFKAKCLELLDHVNRTGEVLKITKRGKIVAELRAPEPDLRAHSGPGFAKGEFSIVGDIMSPIEVKWEAMK
ncbi:MAG: type II toxin-antitoxin system prevent-host-death family antitoxin [Armatimonadetes bacterium]|nr:type II toxin-antitoxin system prevent-host-death family antitoxin [Armatimonadota bacterium]